MDSLKRLQELGLTLSIENQPGDEFGEDVIALVKNEDGKVVGKFPFNTSHQEYKNIKGIDPISSKVLPGYQGKGIASSVYNEIENQVGGKIIPADVQSVSGQKLHDSHGYGKSFGLSEDQLESMLTPDEKAARGIRKNILSSMIDDVGAGKFGTDMEELKMKFNPHNSFAANNIADKLNGVSEKNTPSLLNNLIQESPDLDSIIRAKPSIISKVKSFAGPAVGLGLTALLAPDNASASDFIPGLDQAESAGNSDDDFIMQGEAQGHTDYKKSPARFDAIRKKLGR